jgi:hypothetical protein
MLVKIGKAKDFTPIFGFFTYKLFEDISYNKFKLNFKFLKKIKQFTRNIPLLEFP